MSVLWIRQCSIRDSTSADDTSLPRLPQEEDVHDENRYCYGAVQAELPAVGYCRVLDRNQPEGNLQYEATP